MARPIFDRERAVRILVEAAATGDKKTCERWKITQRTLWNYRKRLHGDPELSAAFTALNREADRSWKMSRQKALEIGMRRLAELFENATDINELSRAVERLGNLDVASEALSVGASTDSESSKAPIDASHPAQKFADSKDSIIFS